MKTRLLILFFLLGGITNVNAQTTRETEQNSIDMLRFADDLLGIQAKLLFDTSASFLDVLNNKTDQLNSYVSGMKYKAEQADNLLRSLNKLKQPVEYTHGGDHLSADTTTIRKKTEFVICCTVALGNRELADMLEQIKWSNFHTINLLEEDKFYGRTNMASFLASDAGNILEKINEIENKPFGQLVNVFYDGHYYSLAVLKEKVTAIKDFASKSAAEIKKLEEERIAPYKKALTEGSDKYVQWKYYIGPRGCCQGAGGVELCTPEQLAKNSRWFFYSYEETLIGPFWTMVIITYNGTKETSRNTRTGYGGKPSNNQYY
jgi:hypothetical protein